METLVVKRKPLATQNPNDSSRKQRPDCQINYYVLKSE